MWLRLQMNIKTFTMISSYRQFSINRYCLEDNHFIELSNLLKYSLKTNKIVSNTNRNYHNCQKNLMKPNIDYNRYLALQPRLYR